MREALQPIIEKVWRHCETSGVRGRTVTLKVKFSDFTQVTRSRSVPGLVCDRDELERIAADLLRQQSPMPKGVRLLGVTLSNLATAEVETRQMDFGLLM